MPSPLFTLVLAVVLIAADWPIFGHDSSHSGFSGDRSIDVRSSIDLHVRWRIKLDAVADNASIVVGNRLFQTSRDGTTYAIDTQNGNVVWRFATHGPNITTSVPAYDLAHDILYAGGVDGFVHKLDPEDGREFLGRGFPARITNAPQTEKNASPLNVANGYVYAQTGGYIGDWLYYVGHVVAIRISDGTKHVFNALCSGRHELIDPQDCRAQRAGMWSRAGVVVDPEPEMRGQIYVATGNGPFAPRYGDFADSVLALDADASRLDGFMTPRNYEFLDRYDLDTGTTAPVLLPRQRDTATPLLAVQGGKDGVLTLFDRTRLPGLGAPLQELSIGPAVYCAPAVWVDPHRTTYVFVGLADGVHAFKLAMTDGKASLVRSWITDVSLGLEGTSPVVDGGIVYVAANGRLIALDASTGQRLASNNTLGLVHWESPTVAGGSVYCSDENGYLTAFTILKNRRQSRT